MRPTLAAVRVKIASVVVMTALAENARAAGDNRRISVTAAGRPVVEIALKGEAVRIAGAPGESVLLGSPHGANKRKYRAEGGPVIAEVTLKPEATGTEPAGFKLRAPDGTLLWKVKFADWKINISADEEGTRPWVISLKRADKLNVLDPDGQNLGSVVLAIASRSRTPLVTSASWSPSPAHAPRRSGCADGGASHARAVHPDGRDPGHGLLNDHRRG